MKTTKKFLLVSPRLHRRMKQMAEVRGMKLTPFTDKVIEAGIDAVLSQEGEAK